MSQLPRFEQLLDQQPEEEAATGRSAWHLLIPRQVLPMTFSSYAMEDALDGDEEDCGWIVGADLLGIDQL
eukprot:Skav206035  [mRNA]  locus=scaffold1314:460710:461420:+ [translate_table: standard]